VCVAKARLQWQAGLTKSFADTEPSMACRVRSPAIVRRGEWGALPTPSCPSSFLGTADGAPARAGCGASKACSARKPRGTDPNAPSYRLPGHSVAAPSGGSCRDPAAAQSPAGNQAPGRADVLDRTSQASAGAGASGQAAPGPGPLPPRSPGLDVSDIEGARPQPWPPRHKARASSPRTALS
jgi:hypothetical protein